MHVEGRVYGESRKSWSQAFDFLSEVRGRFPTDQSLSWVMIADVGMAVFCLLLPLTPPRRTLLGRCTDLNPERLV